MMYRLYDKQNSLIREFETEESTKAYQEYLKTVGEEDTHYFDFGPEQYVFSSDLSEEQQKKIVLAAAKKGITVDEFIKEVLTEEIEKVKQGQEDNLKTYRFEDPDPQGSNYIIRETYHKKLGAPRIVYNVFRDNCSTWTKPGEFVFAIDPENWNFFDEEQEEIKLDFHDAMIAVDIYAKFENHWYEDYKLVEQVEIDE